VTDIVERLLDPDDMDEYHDVRREASIEIKRLRAEIERLEEIIADRFEVKLKMAAEIKRLQSTLVTKQDMQDAETLAEMIAADEEPFMSIDWRHDIAQAIADGRRVAEQKLEPHAYVPSAMRDCNICGNLQGHLIHSPFRRRGG